MKHHHDSNCQEILASLNDYIDGDLDSVLCRVLESHLETCTDCQIVLNTLEKTIELCRQDCENIILPPDVRHRLFSRLGLDEDANQDE